MENDSKDRVTESLDKGIEALRQEFGLVPGAEPAEEVESESKTESDDEDRSNNAEPVLVSGDERLHLRNESNYSAEDITTWPLVEIDLAAQSGDQHLATMALIEYQRRATDRMLDEEADEISKSKKAVKEKKWREENADMLRVKELEKHVSGNNRIDDPAFAELLKLKGIGYSSMSDSVAEDSQKRIKQSLGRLRKLNGK